MRNNDSYSETNIVTTFDVPCGETYKNCFQALPQGWAYHQVILKDDKPVDYIFLDANPAFENLTGLKLNDIQGQKVSAVIPGVKNAKPDLISIYGDVALKGKNKQIELFFEPLDKWFSISVSSPQKGFFMTVFDDITTKKEINENYREEQERYQLVTEATNQGLWDWNVATNEVFYSDQWKKQIGYQGDELKNEFKTWQDHLHPDDYDRCMKAVTAYLEKPKGKFVVEFRFRHKKGHYIWVHNQAASLKDKNGKVVRMFGAHSDISQQKALESKMLLSEEKHRAIFQASTDALLIADFEGNIVEANPAACKIYGFSHKEMVNKKALQLIHPDYHPRFAEFVKSLQKSGSYVGETVDIRKDGSTFETEVHGSLITYNEKTHVLAVIRDNSDKKAHLKEIEEKTNEYFSTLNDAPALIWKAGTDAKCNWFNRGWLEWTGRSMEQEIGDGWAEGVHPEDFDRCLKIYLDAFKAREAFEMEYRLRQATGEYGWILDIGKPVYNIDNEFDGYIGYCYDITERINDENRLIESEEKFHTLYDFSPDMFASVSPVSAKIMECNNTLLDATGYTKEEIIGKPIFDMYAEEILPDVKAVFKQFVETGIVKNKELILKRKDGSFIDVSLNVNSVKDDEGNILYSMSSWHDITDRKKSEALVQQFKTAVDSSPDQIFLIDPHNMKFIDVNETACKTLDYSHEELCAMGPHEIKPFYTEKQLKEVLINILDENKEGTIETVHQSSKGLNIPVEVIIKPFEQNNKKLLIAVARDIAERKKYEQYIIQEKEFSDSILNAMPGIFYMFDKTGKFLRWNDAFEEHSGFSKKEILQKTPLDFIAKYDRVKVESAIQAAFIEGSVTVEADFLVQGKSVPFYFTGRRIVLDGNPHLLGVGIDITRRKIAEQERSKALDELTERMKEMSCLYLINEIFKKGHDDMAKVLKEVAAVIPLGWHYPEKTAVEIQFDTHCVKSENFKDPQDQIIEKIVIGGEEKGYIKVVVFDLNKIQSKQTFLKEEKTLLKAISSNISNYISRIKFEKAVQESEKQFKMLMTYSPLSKVITDLDNNIEFINDSFVKTIGYTHDDMKTVDEWWPLAYPDEKYREEIRETWVAEVGQAISEDRPSKPIEAHIQCKDGETRIFEVVASKIGSKILIVFNDLTERIRAREERDRFFNVSLDLLCIAGTDGYFKQMNPAWETTLGWTLEELTTTPFLEYIHPDDIEPTLKEVEKLSAGKPTINFTNRYRHKDGSYRFLNWVTAPFGESLYASATDITELTIAEQKLKESEARLQSLFSNSPVSLWDEDWTEVIAEIAKIKEQGITDFKTFFNSNPDVVSELLPMVKIIDVNQETLKMFEADSKEDLLSSLEVVFATEDTIPGFIGELIALAEGKQIYETEMLLQTAKGNLINTFLRMNFPGPDDPGGQVLVSIMDISELKKYEKQLSEAKQRLDIAIEGGKIGIWEWDLKTDVTIWDNRMEKIFGLEVGTFGRDYASFKACVHADDVAHTEAAIRDALEKDIPYDTIYRVVWKTSEVRYINASAALLRDDAKNPVKMVGVCVDVTDIKRAEAKLINLTSDLKRSNEELEQFAYVASHDLQEPLRMVSSYTQLLEKKFKEHVDEKAQKYIFYAVDGANRMQRLITDLLEYSRITTRGQSFDKIKVESALESAFRNLKMAIANSAAKITHDKLPEIVGDGPQISRLLQNLVGNSIKFKNDKPLKIHISVKNKDNEWLFAVKDNGIGIDQKYKDRIFVIFQRLHGRTEYPGTGIGLAICKRIVNRHGGKIWFESEPGKGTTFYFTIAKNQHKGDHYDAN